MDELDNIAEKVGARVRERSYSGLQNDPVQKVRTGEATDMSRPSTGFRNQSVDATSQGIPDLDDEESKDGRLSRVLTGIESRSRRVATVFQGLQEITSIPPEDIPDFLASAQHELLAAVDSIGSVLATLPGMSPYYSQRATETGYESEAEQQAVFEPQRDLEDYVQIPYQAERTCTERASSLQDLVAGPEQDVRQDLVPPVTFDSPEGQDTSRLHRTATEDGDFKTPGSELAEQTIDFEPPVVALNNLEVPSNGAEIEEHSPPSRQDWRRFSLSPVQTVAEELPFVLSDSGPAVVRMPTGRSALSRDNQTTIPEGEGESTAP
jgi:hypothetical protein